MKLLPLLLFTLLASCAAYRSYNKTKHGVVNLIGGVYQDKSWDDELEFQRISWYHGFSLYYDALLYKADPESPFSLWFSPHEKEFFSKCESLLISVNYSADPAKISHVTFREQMKLNGYDDVVLSNFATYIRTHSHAQEWRFFNYKIMGYCKRAPSRMGGDNVIINFPGFKTEEFDI